MIHDVLIIGSGIAGLYAGILLQKRFSTLVLCKRKPEECNTAYAQGGIATSLSEEDIERHINDTMEAGCRLNNPQAVRLLCERSREVIDDLLAFGVPFDRNDSGELLYTREGAHSENRILHGDGDATGRVILSRLLEIYQGEIRPHTVVTDLLIHKGRCYGVSISDAEGQRNLYARHVLIASGGLGSLYAVNTNARTTSGDLQGIMTEKGCPLRDMEMLQFHPTVFVDNTWARKFLLSEALRGEGATIIDSKGQRFLETYDSRGELAPRDILSRAIFDYRAKTGKAVFLSLNGFTKERIQQRFPNIYRNLTELGFHLPEDPIPISPAFHYAMGGIPTDLHGRIEGFSHLYASGEAACSGVHGANRLASNSLLEGLVFSREIVRTIEQSEIDDDSLMNFPEPKFTLEIPSDEAGKEQLREIMWKNVGIIREVEQLHTAMNAIQEMLEQPVGRLLQLRLYCARAIIEAALNRRDSLGAHYIV